MGAFARAAQPLLGQKVQSSRCSLSRAPKLPSVCKGGATTGVSAARVYACGRAGVTCWGIQVAELQARERMPAGARQVAEDVEQQEAELPDAGVDAPEPEADAAAVEAAVGEAAPEPADEQYSVRPAGFLRVFYGVPCPAARSGCPGVLMSAATGACEHICHERHVPCMIAVAAALGGTQGPESVFLCIFSCSCKGPSVTRKHCRRA